MSDPPRRPGPDDLDLGAFSIPTATPEAPAPAPVASPTRTRPVAPAAAAPRTPALAPVVRPAAPVATATRTEELPYDETPPRTSSRWMLLGPILAGVLLAVVVVVALAIGRSHRQAGPPSPAGGRTATNGTTAGASASTTAAGKGSGATPTKGAAGASTTAAAAVASFGDGVHVVPTAVKPGRYVSAGGDGCYWARERDTSGNPEAIIANSVDPNRAVVDVAPTDGAFETSGCGTWTSYVAPAQASTSFGDGTFVVGGQIAPGVYTATATGSCHWSRLSSFAGTPDAVVAGAFADGATSVTIAATDVGFATAECGTWTKSG